MTEPAQLLRLPETLDSQRLHMRIPNAADAAALNAAIAFSFEQLQRWLPWAKQVPTLAQTEQFCVEAQRRFSASEAFEVILEEKSSGEIVGASGYPRLAWQAPRFEIGYWCRSDRTGCGLISEAVATLARYAFDALAAARVELFIDDRNLASIAVAQRLGFTLEGVLRSEVRNNLDQLCDTRIYAAVALSELKLDQPG
jgi:ribosomal-protein-serine acetyltransferase